MDDLKAIIEAMIFSSESPLAPAKIKDALGEIEKSEVVKAIGEIAAEHEARQGGFVLEEIAGGFQFRTRPALSAWVRKIRGVKPGSLSPAAMETLAVIAYRQPVLKADIDRIRGVDVSGALRGLLEKKLVKMLGRKDVPGRPMMYGTTRSFLEVFNLKDLGELPTLRELKELQDDMAVQGELREVQDFTPVKEEKELQEEAHIGVDDKGREREIPAGEDNEKNLEENPVPPESKGPGEEQ